MNQENRPDGDAPGPLLEVTGVSVGYNRGSEILHDVSIRLHRGEAVTVIGPNGAGKSTLLKAIIGVLHPSTGGIRFDGSLINKLAPHEVVRRGLAYVPQLENVFPSLTVRANLEMSCWGLRRRKREARVTELFSMFPALPGCGEKPVGALSGGQRQVVAMARALMPKPKALLLDEPSAGLAPKFVDLAFNQIATIRQAGVAVLLVEQNARRALAMSNRGYVLESGANRLEGTGQELLTNETVLQLYLGVRHN